MQKEITKHYNEEKKRSYAFPGKELQRRVYNDEETNRRATSEEVLTVYSSVYFVHNKIALNTTF